MSGQCCATGEIHQGTPAGREAKVHGLDCYVTEPPQGASPKGVIVVLPDGFGWQLNNTRILADNYAKKGQFLVYLPEFMNGEPLDQIPLGSDIEFLISLSHPLLSPVISLRLNRSISFLQNRIDMCIF